MADVMIQISDGQKLALIKLCGRFTKDRSCRLWMLSKLLGKEVESTGNLLLEDWRKIRDRAYPNWPNNDWEVSEDFTRTGRELYRQYEKEILGQMRLFE